MEIKNNLPITTASIINNEKAIKPVKSAVNQVKDAGTLPIINGLKPKPIIEDTLKILSKAPFSAVKGNRTILMKAANFVNRALNLALHGGKQNVQKSSGILGNLGPGPIANFVGNAIFGGFIGPVFGFFGDILTGDTSNMNYPMQVACGFVGALGRTLITLPLNIIMIAHTASWIQFANVAGWWSFVTGVIGLNMGLDFLGVIASPILTSIGAGIKALISKN